MKYSNEVQEGWNFASKVLGANIATNIGSEYVNAVNEQIQLLEDNINNHQYRNLGIKQLQGYMFEEFEAGTYNIDAVASGSSNRAKVLHSTGKDSVDVLISNGEKEIAQYSAKSYSTGEKSAVEQARYNNDLNRASYKNQGRLVPEDQLSDAKMEAHRRAVKNELTRPEIAESYAEAEFKLTDVISTDDGTKSKSIKRKELDQIAKESEEQKFKASNHGITADDAVKVQYMLNQAFKAGATTAAVSVAFELAPEIYKAIDYLIKNGEINLRQVNDMGIKTISAGAEGFLRGFIASALQIMCEAGKLGDALSDADPTHLGIIVAIVLQTAKNSILVAAGKMSAQQMGSAFVDNIIVSGGYLAGAELGQFIGSKIGTGLGAPSGPATAVLGYILGSLIGTSFCVAYNVGKKKLISFCVDTGFTCFGLVEQDYELPESVLNELGIDTIPIPRTRINRTEVNVTLVEQKNTEKAEYETINMTVLKRGVIGINKVGYVF